MASETLGERLRKRPVGRAPSGPLFGRGPDVELVARALADGNRLVTLTGPPGVGKTTLARHVLANARSEARAGVFVDLADARTAEDVVLVLARTLGIAGDETGTIEMERIAAELATAGSVLLALDNFEQLVADASSIVEPLLSAPEVALLVTSRERLRLSDELVHSVAPLSVPRADDVARASIEATDAVRLFLDRRARAGVREPPSDEELLAIRDLARALDGWPLAIELAAARLPIMTARALLERIGARFEVLSGGASRDGSRRRLDVAIEWSLSLLPEVVREALERATVFEGGLDLTAAEAVLVSADEPRSTAIDRLEALHDASLLFAERTARGDIRYTLYASVAEYARDHAASETLASAERAHEAHFVARGREAAWALDGPSAAEALSFLQREESNLDAIVRRATARGDAAALHALVLLDPLRTLRGPIDRQLDQLDRAIASVATPPAAVLAAALRARGRARWLRGRPDEAERDLRDAVALGEQHPAVQLDEASRDLGVFLRARGAMLEAEGWLSRAAKLATDDGARAGALADLGILRKERGDLGGARTAYEGALATFRAIRHLRGEARVLCDLGALEQEEGAYPTALECFERALSITLSLGDVRLEAIARSDAGALALETGDLAAAERSFAVVVERLDAVGDRRYAALFSAARAAALAGLGRIDEADALFATSEAALSRARDRLFLGTVRVHRGHLDLARAAAHRASGDRALAEASRAAADERIAAATRPEDGGSSLASLSDDVRLAIRALRRALERADQPSILLGPEAMWVVLPSGERVALDSKPVLRRLVLALAEAYARGAALGADELVRAGWPGERIASAAAKNRLGVALTSLRDLGLRDALVRDDVGYRLDPALQIVRVED